MHGTNTLHNELEADNEVNKMQDTYDNFMGHSGLTCEDCGIYASDTEDEVKNTTCPYAEEIHGRQVPITVCDSCYRERSYDI